MLDWIREHDALLWWCGAASVVMFVGTLVVVPILVARIPADYFTRDEPLPTPWVRAHPALRIALHVVKNVIGIVLLAAGAAMLVLPGQGILTMLMGVVLLDFPGKYALERWLIMRRPVARAVAWIRRRAGREPLRPPTS